MGANSYIGNAPNFMVKAIAEDRGICMPSFFGYMAWSCCVLLPLFGQSEVWSRVQGPPETCAEVARKYTAPQTSPAANPPAAAAPQPSATTSPSAAPKAAAPSGAAKAEAPAR